MWTRRLLGVGLLWVGAGSRGGRCRSGGTGGPQSWWLCGFVGFVGFVCLVGVVRLVRFRRWVGFLVFLCFVGFVSLVGSLAVVDGLGLDWRVFGRFRWFVWICFLWLDQRRSEVARTAYAK